LESRWRFLRILYALLFILTLGVIGYMFIEGWTFLDALYMTVVTISTVGYEEVHVLTQAGRIFTILLIIGGVGVMLYTLTAFVQYLLEGNLANMLGRRRMKERIGKLKDHIILCGFGQVGQEVARAFRNENAPFVIIEENEQSVMKAGENDYLYIEGDATNDDILKEAGIEKARALVAALATDADNLYLTLSARKINPHLFIVTRTLGTESEPKLKQAGADRTMSPYRIGGRRMAMLTLHPLVVDFIDTTMQSRGKELVLENVVITDGSPVDKVTVREGMKHYGGATILALKKKNGRFLANPAPLTLLEVGDELIIIGTDEQLRSIEDKV